jgi:hypothetical protein
MFKTIPEHSYKCSGLSQNDPRMFFNISDCSWTIHYIPERFGMFRNSLEWWEKSGLSGDYCGTFWNIWDHSRTFEKLQFLNSQKTVSSMLIKFEYKFLFFHNCRTDTTLSPRRSGAARASATPWAVQGWSATWRPGSAPARRASSGLTAISVPTLTPRSHPTAARVSDKVFYFVKE